MPATAHNGEHAAAHRRSRTLRRVGALVATLAVGALLVWLAVAVVTGAGGEKSVVHGAADSVAALRRNATEKSWRLGSDSSVVVTPANVVAVLDGDTATFRLAGGKQEEVRLIGIDAPELAVQRDMYGVESAKQAASMLHRGSPVFLETGPDKRDAYGRMLAYVWLTEPKARPTATEVRNGMLNARMLATGYAQLSSKGPNTRYSELFGVFASEAQAIHRGIWSPKFVKLAGPSAAWPTGTVAASTESTAITSPYVGNKVSKKFHHSWCENAKKMRLSRRVPLTSRKEAIAGGFIPCGICKP